MLFRSSDFSVSHGSAVAIGMVLASRGAYRTGMTENDCTAPILAALQKYDLPTATEYTAQQLLDRALSDKKRDGGAITLVIPKTLGECVLQKVSTDALLPFIEKGLGQ